MGGVQYEWDSVEMFFFYFFNKEVGYCDFSVINSLLVIFRFKKDTFTIKELKKINTRCTPLYNYY